MTSSTACRAVRSTRQWVVPSRLYDEGDFCPRSLELTLAASEVNRCGAGGKCHHDAAEWLPQMNQCWFAGRILDVRRKYRLTIDRREVAALEQGLSRCTSTDMVFERQTSVPARPSNGKRSPSQGALRRWDDNHNGRITSKEARRHGIAPVRRGHPAYSFMRDQDGDGTICE